MFDGYLRDPVNKLAEPVGVVLQKTGVSANGLTTFGIAAAIATAWAVGTGRLLLGLGLLVLTGLCDLLDGPVAKAAGKSSTQGAFYDSVADRLTDVLLLSGIAWHLNSSRSGNIYFLAVAIMAVSLLISYQRAKAESLGLQGKGGIMERAERFIVLGAGLLFEVLLLPILWVLLGLVALTALQRFYAIWRQATKSGPDSGGPDSLTGAAADAEAGAESKPETEPAPTGGLEFGYHLYRAGTWLIQHAPKRLVNGAAWLAAQAAYLLASRRRRLLKRHLARVHAHTQATSAIPAHPGAPAIPATPATRRQLARQARQGFVSYARYYVSSARQLQLLPVAIDAGFSYHSYGEIHRARMASQAVGSAPGQVSDQTADQAANPTASPAPAQLADPTALPQGVILALPHLGNWEWAGHWLTQVPGIPVSAVVETPASQKLFAWMTSFREKLNMHVIPLDANAGSAASRALADGHVLCLLCDRDIQRNGVEVEFFGETTTLPAGPATLALRSGVAVLPTAVYFDGDRQYALVMPPLDTARRPNSKFRQEVQRITQDLAHKLEELIARAPEQWHLLSPNWPADFEPATEQLAN